IRRLAPCERVRRSRRRSLSRSDRPARGSPRRGTTESPARATETTPSFRQSQAGSSRRRVNGRRPFSEVFSRLPRGDAWAWAAGSSTASAIAWRDSVIIDTPRVKRYNPKRSSSAGGSLMRIPIRDLVRYFLRLGLLGFGGPVALVGQMERGLVGEKKGLTEDEKREGIAVCQSLPGPLAIQVGIWISYIRGGFWGAWAGGWAFILPNFVIVAAMGALYVYFGGLSPVKAIFYGVSPAVIALILHSCYRLTKL